MVGLSRRHIILSTAVCAIIATAAVLLGISPWSGGKVAMQPGDVVIQGKTVDTAPWVAAPDGLIEQLGVANISAGATGYQYSTNVAYDQVIKVEVSFENPTSHVIYDIVPSISLPNQPGAEQPVGVSLTDANGASLNQSIPVVLDDSQGTLQFEPGTVQWGHLRNGDRQVAVTTQVPDRVLSNGAPIETLAAHSTGSLAFLMREVVPGITVSVAGHGDSIDTWSKQFDAPLHSTVYFRITIQDDGNTPLSEVFVADQLPADTSYVPGSAQLTYSGPNTPQPTSVQLPNGMIEATLGSSPGAPLPAIAAGPLFASLLDGKPASLLPGEVATITFRAELDATPSTQTSLDNNAQVRALGFLPIPNNASLKVEPR
jgi:uncharacterized repeat protein (TIGR01451 family)